MWTFPKHQQPKYIPLDPSSENSKSLKPEPFVTYILLMKDKGWNHRENKITSMPRRSLSAIIPCIPFLAPFGSSRCVFIIPLRLLPA